MQRQNRWKVALGALTLVASAGSAAAQVANRPQQQQQQQSRSFAPRHAVQLAERIKDKPTTLADAIQTAERHVSGVAVGVRVSMNSAPFQNMDGRAGRDQYQPVREITPVGDRGVEPHADRPESAQTTQERQYATDSLFAIVTCVVDRSKVREVIVDLRDSSVLGVLSIPALQEVSEYDGQRTGYYTESSRPSMARASDLMNATARNAEGGLVGDIDELAIDPDANRVVYGVLRRGGFLGVGESRYAVATSELSAPHDGRILLNLHDADFQGQSGFDNQRWPTAADPEWSAAPSANGVPPHSAKSIVKASAIIGSVVNGRDGKEIGRISDLIIEPCSGRIVYAVVGAGRGQMPVPMGSLSRNGEIYSLPMTDSELLTKPVIESGREPDWNDARWSRRVHSTYGAQDATSSELVDRDNRERR